jgi:hypothetical protein
VANFVSDRISLHVQRVSLFFCHSVVVYKNLDPRKKNKKGHEIKIEVGSWPVFVTHSQSMVVYDNSDHKEKYI